MGVKSHALISFTHHCKLERTESIDYNDFTFAIPKLADKERNCEQKQKFRHSLTRCLFLQMFTKGGGRGLGGGEGGIIKKSINKNKNYTSRPTGDSR